MKDFDGETPYTIMFGPDICGFSTKKVHTILTHNGDNHLINKEIECKTDETSHVYTLVLKPDNSYEVRRERACAPCGWSLRLVGGLVLHCGARATASFLP